jgi:ABC-2 type transport system ATP-binding protein
MTAPAAEPRPESSVDGPGVGSAPHRRATVHVSDLALRYGRTAALDGVSFSLQDGVTGLLGPNGAGKTTLLRILATAITADRGELSVLGHDPRTAPGRLAVRRRLGYLPQNPGFHPHFTAFEFVDYVAILKELANRRARHDEVRRVLHAVGLDGKRGVKIKALSGGMRQRVALAAALLADPALVILDEPTVGLDPEQRLRFRELIASSGEGRTVLLSTHQTEDVMTVCQRVIVLDHGRDRFQGVPADLSAVARGRVWTSASRSPGALAAWRTGAGTYHNIGEPPPGAQLVDPSIEDGYLLLIDAVDEASVAA